jgi:hypothetical protein
VFHAPLADQAAGLQAMQDARTPKPTQAHDNVCINGRMASKLELPAAAAGVKEDRVGARTARRPSGSMERC